MLISWYPQDFILDEIKFLITEYRQKMTDADKMERPIYSCIIDDLKEILSEYAHR